MSPRFERRPDKWAGAGGRKPERPGGSFGRNREGGREGSRDGGRPPGPRPGGRERDGSRERSGGWDRAGSGERRLERGREPRREPVRGQGERGSFPRRPGAASLRRGGGERRPEGARFEPRSRDGARPRRTLPSRFSGPVLVDASPRQAPPEAPQGLHADDSQASDLIWGRHAALAALESGRPVHRIWCTPEMRFSPKFLQLLREAKASGVLVEDVTWARLGQLTGGAVHQGIVLQTAAADTLDLPSLIEGCRELGEPPLLMALDGITDPHNLGAIARSAEALGAHGLVLPQRRSAGLTGSVAKVAAGALEHLPVARVVNLNRALDSLKQEGYRVVGLAAEGSVSLEEADLEGPLVIVTGSEGDGLSMLTRKHCDQLVSIPLRGVTPSLNASVATALLLYEVARRGWMKGLRGGEPAPRIVRPQLPTPTPPADLTPEEPAQPEAAAAPLPQAAPEPEAVPALPAPAQPESAPPAPVQELAESQPQPEAEVEPAQSSEPEPEPAPLRQPAVELGFAPAPARPFQGDVQL